VECNRGILPVENESAELQPDSTSNGSRATAAGFLLGPHSGSFYITEPFRNERIPNPYKMNWDLNGPLLIHFTAPPMITVLKPLQLVGASPPPHDEAAKYQKLLKKIPDEFQDIEKRLLSWNKSHRSKGRREVQLAGALTRG
jgi:hypothetical protein